MFWNSPILPYFIKGWWKFITDARKWNAQSLNCDHTGNTTAPRDCATKYIQQSKQTRRLQLKEVNIMLALANLMLTTATNTRLTCLCSLADEIDKSQFSEYTRIVCDSLRKVNVNKLIWWVFCSYRTQKPYSCPGCFNLIPI